MRIELAQQGGIGYFPALSKSKTVHVDRLHPDAAAKLKSLVDQSKFFDLPANVGTPAKGAADYQHITLTVEDGKRSHTVRTLVPVENPALRDLIEAVQTHAR